jgi:nicotinamidase-related amidase
MTEPTIRNIEDCALLTIECQRGLTDPTLTEQGLAARCDAEGTIEKIAVLAASMRAAGRPVIHNVISHRASYAGTGSNAPLFRAALRGRSMAESTPDVELDPRLGVAESDLVVVRRQGLTSFHGTELEAVLRHEGVVTVALVGVSTELGILGAAIEAVNRGFNVVTVEDCVTGVTDESHHSTLSGTLPALGTVAGSDFLISALNILESSH